MIRRKGNPQKAATREKMLDYLKIMNQGEKCKTFGFVTA